MSSILVMPALPRRTCSTALAAMRSLAVAAALATALGAAVPALAQNAARGEALFFDTNNAPVSCGTVSCHDGFPAVRRNNINLGSSASRITAAITSNKGGMGILTGFVSAQDAADLAAYIANPGAAAAPVAQIAPTALAFAAQPVGSTGSALTATLRNAGAGTLTLGAITLTGANAADFVRAGGNCTAGGALVGGASCTLGIAFAPASGGARAAALSIAHSAAGSPTTVTLTGTAAAATPTVSLSTAALAFPSTPVGASNALPAVTLTNTGSAPLTISALTLAGTHAGDFTLGGTCAAGTSVAAGGSCTLVASFAPQAVGARAASLSIVSNNSGGTVTLALSGTGAANTPTLTLSTGALAFGAQQVGTTSGARSVTLTNTGGGLLSISAVTTAAPFAAAGSCAGASLANNQSCSIAVSFAPAAAVASTGALSISHSAAALPATIALSGTGSAAPVPAVSLSRAAVSFAGVTAVGQSSAPERLSFANAGPGSVTIASIAASGDFAPAAGGCAVGQVVAAGAGCTIDLRFAPTAPGTRTGTLIVASNGAPADATAALSGSGSSVASPALAPSPAQLAFGTVAAGVSMSQPLTLANSGSTNLVVSALATRGPFALAGGTCGAPPFTLTPGAACSVAVALTAAGSGAVSGSLDVTSNGAPAAVPLSADVRAAAARSTNVGGGGGALDPRSALGLAMLLAAAAWLRSHAARHALRRRHAPR